MRVFRCPWLNFIRCKGIRCCCLKFQIFQQIQPQIQSCLQVRSICFRTGIISFIQYVIVIWKLIRDRKTRCPGFFVIIQGSIFMISRNIPGCIHRILVRTYPKRKILRFPITTIQLQINNQPLIQTESGIGTSRQRGHVISFRFTPSTVDSHGKTTWNFFPLSRDTDIMGMAETISEQNIKPIGIHPLHFPVLLFKLQPGNLFLL